MRVLTVRSRGQTVMTGVCWSISWTSAVECAGCGFNFVKIVAKVKVEARNGYVVMIWQTGGSILFVRRIDNSGDQGNEVTVVWSDNSWGIWAHNLAAVASAIANTGAFIHFHIKEVLVRLHPVLQVAIWTVGGRILHITRWIVRGNCLATSLSLFLLFETIFL